MDGATQTATTPGTWLLLKRFLVTNLVLFLVFWAVRWPIADDPGHFRVRMPDGGIAAGEDVNAFFVAGYTSAITQSTVGASDVEAVSTYARLVTAAQSMSVVLSVLSVMVLTHVRH